MESVLVFARRHATLVFGLAIAAGLSGVFLVSRISFDANILRLLPQRSPSVRDFQFFLQNFGSLDHLYLVFNAPDAIGDHGELLDRYIDGLRQAPEIESVDAQLFEPGKDWGYLSDRELYLLGTDGAGRGDWPAFDRRSSTAEISACPGSPVDAVSRHQSARSAGSARAADDAARSYESREGIRRVRSLYAGRGTSVADGRSRLVVVKPKGAPCSTPTSARRSSPSVCRLSRRRRASGRGRRRPRRAAPSRSSAAGAYRVSLGN